MTLNELQTNLADLYANDSSIQPWLERKWIPHQHVSSDNIDN